MAQQFPFDRFLKKSQTPIASSTQNLTSDEQVSNDLFSSDELSEISKSIHEQLKVLIATPKYLAYFDTNFPIIKLTEEKIFFRASTQFIKNMIENHYENQIQESIQNVLGKKYQIVIEAKQQTLADSEEYIKRKAVKDIKFTLDLNQSSEDVRDRADSKYINHMNNNHSDIHSLMIDPEKNFDNFIIGPSNNMAYATACAVAKNPGKSGKYPSLYFYSNSGLGKTHLLHAVANGIKENHPSSTICLITARDFMKEMISAMQNNKMSEFQHRYSRRIDVLMIDDIHELKDKKGTQNEFFHVFNALYNAGKQLIFTSDKPPKEIDGIEERIKTRLQWGLVVDIQRPDLETRIAILKRKAEKLDLYLSDEIFSLIAYTIKSSIRELEGSLIKLSAFAEVMNTEIDVEMVKQLLNLENISETKKITIENIAKACSSHYKIPLADLKSKARNKDIAKARHIAMYLSQQIVGSTLIQIGNYFGGRDHTSVMHGVKKIKDALKANDSELSKDLIVIENTL